MKELRKRLLKELLAYYEDFITQQDELSVTEELVETQLQVAELLKEIGEDVRSQAVFDKAWHNWQHCPSAQNRPPPAGFAGPGGPQRGFPRLLLLAQPAVQQDLKLSPWQKNDLSSYINFQPGRMGKAPIDPEKVLAETLTTKQYERLLQISRQLRGPQAILDPESVKGLDLTEKQKKEIETLLTPKRETWPRPGSHSPGPIMVGLGGKRGELGRRESGGSPAMGTQFRPEMDGKQLNELALKVLTPEQQTKWERMLGALFHCENRPGPPRRDNPPYGH